MPSSIPAPPAPHRPYEHGSIATSPFPCARHAVLFYCETTAPIVILFPSFSAAKRAELRPAETRSHIDALASSQPAVVKKMPATPIKPETATTNSRFENHFSVDRAFSVAPSFLTVVVPTLNEEAFIIDTLGRLLDTEFPMDRLEILVVDGGSTDRTVEYAQSMRNVRVIDNPGRLQSIGVNKAVKMADPRSKWIIRCDCHSEYPVDFLGLVAKVIVGLAPEYAAVFYSRVCDIETDHRFRSAAGWAYMSKFGGGTPHRTTGVSGPVEHGWHGAFRKDVFLELGGYDERFVAVEDVDLSFRLRDAGYHIWTDARLSVRYFARDNVHGLWKQFRAYGRGRVDLWNKRPYALKPRHLPLIALAPWTGAVPVAAPYAPWLPLTLLCYCLLLIAIAVDAARRTRWPSLVFYLPFVLAIMHYGWSFGFVEQLVKTRLVWGHGFPESAAVSGRDGRRKRNVPSPHIR